MAARAHGGLLRQLSNSKHRNITFPHQLIRSLNTFLLEQPSLRLRVLHHHGRIQHITWTIQLIRDPSGDLITLLHRTFDILGSHQLDDPAGAAASVWHLICHLRKRPSPWYPDDMSLLDDLIQVLRGYIRHFIDRRTRLSVIRRDNGFPETELLFDLILKLNIIPLISVNVQRYDPHIRQWVDDLIHLLPCVG